MRWKHHRSCSLWYVCNSKTVKIDNNLLFIYFFHFRRWIFVRKHGAGRLGCWSDSLIHVTFHALRMSRWFGQNSQFHDERYNYSHPIHFPSNLQEKFIWPTNITNFQDTLLTLSNEWLMPKFRMSLGWPAILLWLLVRLLPSWFSRARCLRRHLLHSSASVLSRLNECIHLLWDQTLERQRQHSSLRWLHHPKNFRTLYKFHLSICFST